VQQTSIILDGNSFHDLTSFYDEVEKKFTKNLTWRIGRNLDAFNDVLRGGFGQFEFNEPLTIVWNNSSKSKKDLSWNETIEFIEDKLQRCHPSNIKNVQKDLEQAKMKTGKTLFEIIVEIIRSHNHIELSLL
jgi:RNAse (barnase) inhibitor barstar